MTVEPPLPREEEERILAPEETLVVGGGVYPAQRFHRRPKGIWYWLAILGPGLIATSAGNDAGGIATYSQAGAQYGYQLIWVMLLITPCLALVQEMCARLGAATGRGMLDLIRDRFGLAWSTFAVTLILIANSGLVISECVGIASAADLLHLNRFVVVGVSVATLWYMVLFGSFAAVEKALLAMTLVFFAYPIAAVMGHPDPTQLARGALIPSLSRDPGMLMLFVALVGTTITPYMQLYQQSSIVENGVARSHYGPERLDAYAGAIFSNLMSIAMMVATAATLHKTGHTHLQDAADAARALEPVMGAWAGQLFAVGLLGACLLAVTVLPLATAYAVSEAFGFPKGVSLDYRRAPVFFRLFTAILVLGAGVALIPGIPVMPLLIGVQVLNGVLMPVVLVFILLLCNDERLMGSLRNRRWQNGLGWLTVGGVSLAVGTLLLSQFLQLFGIELLGA